MNTAISFATTTAWQAYGGETTLGWRRKTSWPGRLGWRSAAPLFAGWRATAPAAWHDSYTPLFAALLAGTALIVGGSSYLPALAMGPIVEQLLLGR